MNRAKKQELDAMQMAQIQLIGVAAAAAAQASAASDVERRRRCFLNAASKADELLRDAKTEWLCSDRTAMAQNAAGGVG